MKNTVTQKILVFTAFILLGVFSLTLFAQEKKSDIKSKLEQVKGKIDKITLKADGKDITFEGEDAEKLGKIIRTFGRTSDLMWISEDGEEFEGKDGNVMVYKFKDGKGNWTAKDGMKKKVEVKIEDGKKKISVTTTDENGKESTKVYEGEDAEKFLKENEKGGTFNIKIKGDDEDKNVMFFKNFDGDDDCCCCGHKKHKSKMKMHDKDVKKIIIEKMDNKKTDK